MKENGRESSATVVRHEWRDTPGFGRMCAELWKQATLSVEPSAYGERRVAYDLATRRRRGGDFKRPSER